MGDVSPQGFEALRLSIWGAYRLFGARASYLVCLNSMPIERARARTGPLPPGVQWQDVTNAMPEHIRRHFDAGMAEGVAWKLAPLRCFPDRHELSLDNDAILWSAPPALTAWLEDTTARSCLVAEDVRACFGRFAEVCGDGPRNMGIRGLPPHFDLGKALEDTLLGDGAPLSSELDEQGWQLAALQTSGKVHVVSVDDVTICSPFWPHRDSLGRCGAHFVGLNSRQLPWSYDGRPASEMTRENWERLKPAIYAHLDIAPWQEVAA
ncbi:hypothetical protein [Polyangium aurulentum]|uniref:hypothetical protein n=1 Tax=Polyangium aurulentum TaxID=2567896 RepID=UPI00197F65C6|nr:hypothetical protein [Polyangium aurulentum]UQA62962.1 hypothetical protein E8A73_021895 [Polyangium aurulentum]